MPGSALGASSPQPPHSQGGEEGDREEREQLQEASGRRGRTLRSMEAEAEGLEVEAEGTQAAEWLLTSVGKEGQAARRRQR